MEEQGKKTENAFNLEKTDDPFILLKLTRAFRELVPGKEIVVYPVDPGARTDILAVLRAYPCEVVEEKTGKKGLWLRIRKKSI